MADGKNLTECSVCSHYYQIEGEHVPRILCCLCTVCERCIRGKLSKGTALECPLCGAEHCEENGIENIRKNIYIISYLEKLAEESPVKENNPVEEKKECQKHGKEQNLFCRKCQMPICITCLNQEHRGHKICGLEEGIEERCATLLGDVRFVKEALQKKKEELKKVQKIVAQNCQDCTSEVRNVKADLINKINHKAEQLVEEITGQKDKTDSRINKEIANIDEKLVMAKDFEKIAKNKAIFEVDKKKLEKFTSAKSEIQSRFPEATPFTILTFMKCGDMSNCLWKLFGKLTHKNREIGMKVGMAVSYKTDLDKNKENRDPRVSAKTKAARLTSSNQRSCITEACFQQKEAGPVNLSGKTDETTVPVRTDISINQSDAGTKKATGDVLKLKNTHDETLRSGSVQIAKIGPLKDSAKKSEKTHPSTNTGTPDLTHGNSLSLQKEIDMTNVKSAASTTQQAETSDNKKPANNSDHLCEPLSDTVRKIQRSGSYTGDRNPEHHGSNSYRLKATRFTLNQLFHHQ